MYVHFSVALTAISVNRNGLKNDESQEPYFGHFSHHALVYEHALVFRNEKKHGVDLNINDQCSMWNSFWGRHINTFFLHYVYTELYITIC